MARRGAPSLLTLSARRGLNLAYFRVIENLDKDEREEFESEIRFSLVELQLQAEMKAVREKEDRKRLAASFGEVG